jgi:nucleoid-associated protein EbfC
MSFPTDPSAAGGMMGGLQQQMAAMQADAAAAQVEGASGGGLVKVVATGGMEIVSIHIDASVMDDREMLEDLVTAATNDALRRARDVVAQQMAEMMGGMGLPPGMF